MVGLEAWVEEQYAELRGERYSTSHESVRILTEEEDVACPPATELVRGVSRPWS